MAVLSMAEDIIPPPPTMPAAGDRLKNRVVRIACGWLSEGGEV